jgi:5-methylcytosine-specific restriction endonuclease McrA
MVSSKYESKMERLGKRVQKEQQQLTSRETHKNMPSIVAIARCWAERNTFDNFEWTIPSCFACGRFGFANDRIATGARPEEVWSHSGLERCHLIAAASGGGSNPANFALLCTRCHREAPMVGVSVQPMIDWINRREDYYSWLCQRIVRECQVISPTLLEGCASALRLSMDEQLFVLRTVGDFMSTGFHPGGDPSATVAQIVKTIFDHRDRIRMLVEHRRKAMKV